MRDHFEVNVFGVHRITNALLPILLAARGRIVNIASVVALAGNPNTGKSTVFNALTGATAHRHYHKMLVAPVNMRDRFIELVRREVAHAESGHA